MNLEPPLPPPPRFSSCHLHPNQPVTGFCASCLRERLAGLDPANSSSTSTSTLRKPTAAAAASSSSSAAAALRAIFTRGGESSLSSASSRVKSSSKSLLPELRRCKSFSGAKADGVAVCFEPQRKSCDVRVRNTLWSLFHQDDDNRPGSSAAWGEIEEEEEEEEEDIEQDKGKPNNGENANLGVDEEAKDDVKGEEDEEGEIRALEPEIRPAEPVGAEQEIEEEEEEEEEEGIGEEEGVKTIKDHIDLDAQMMKHQTENQTGNKASAAAERRDFKEIAGSLWLAASVFSKKLQKWRRKKKRDGRDPSAASARAERPASSSRFFRETQSEVADYGFGRRSCDTDPRFSLDAGRISFDDARYSFDEPRASWDGHLSARAGLPRMPAMDSVVEGAPALVRRSDHQIPVVVVEEPAPMTSIAEDPSIVPGGSVQTREYYLDSSSSLRRRQTLERSGSLHRSSSAYGDAEETKWVSNSKVSPESLDYFLAANKFSDSRDSVPNSNSLRDDCSESFETAYREAAAFAGGRGLRKGLRKSRRWIKVWNIWGLIHRRGGKEDDYDRYSSRGSVVDRSFSESWPELRREATGLNGNSGGAFGGRVFRSNSCVSWRNSFSNGTFGGGIKSSTKESNGQSKKRREEFVMERNRSARFSPSHFDNGLLRFYLTPLRSSWSGGGSGKSRPRSSHSFARSILRLY